MTKKPIYLSSIHQGGRENHYLQQALVNNALSTGGLNVNGFEEQLESYLGNQSYVVALSSGTAAIHLGLILLGVKSGDEVICQTMTFSASANPILYQGAIPVFVDSEEQTWNLCPIALEYAIIHRIAKGKKPKAIIAVHLYGVPYQIQAVHSIAKKYQIPVLEDSAEALGSSYQGRKCGALGDIGVLSFNGNKIISTSGGGALVVKSQVLKNEAIFFATQSKDKEVHYQHSHIGYNYRMPNICGAIGQGQMESLEKHILLRRANNDFYINLFDDITEAVVYQVPNKDFYANGWLTTVLVDSNEAKGICKEHLRIALEKDNIEARPLWKPLHLQPIFNNYPYYGTNVAENLFDKGLCLPSGSNLTDADKSRIKNIIITFFKK